MDEPQRGSPQHSDFWLKLAALEKREITLDAAAGFPYSPALLFRKRKAFLKDE